LSALRPSGTAIWRPAYVALGSNLNDPRARVLEGFERLASLSDVRLEARARLYRSTPLGPQDQPDFVNTAAGLLTRLSARELLNCLLAIERAMGRDRGTRWGPRVIDLDLICLSGERIDEPGLSVPHPAVSERNFVLYPLADVAPHLRIPGHGDVTVLKEQVGAAGLEVISDGASTGRRQRLGSEG
jgi:2-amino-4-hydroxy-6-hydroxymethyldihydropteridine diphosphokinase